MEWDNLWLNIAQWLKELLSSWGLQPFGVDLIMMIVEWAAIVGIITINCLILVWLERKISAFIQMRLGPNRLGPFGVFQTLADAIKLLAKEDIIPQGADKHIFPWAPIGFMTIAVLLYLVLPFGHPGMAAFDTDLGLFYFLSIASLSTVCLLAAGWGSNSKYSLLGALRAVAQMVSYELPMVFSILGVVMLAGTLSLPEILAAQSKYWFILLQPLGFIIFLFAAAAELARKPFDLPEGEQELTAGVYTEYSGIRWALFFLAEYTNLFAVCALATTVFLGGGSGPLLPGWFWFFLKVYFLMWLMMWIGWTFPRIRIDQLMSLSWKYLVPLSLANVLLTGIGIYLVRGMGG